MDNAATERHPLTLQPGGCSHLNWVAVYRRELATICDNNLWERDVVMIIFDFHNFYFTVAVYWLHLLLMHERCDEVNKIHIILLLCHFACWWQGLIWVIMHLLFCERFLKDHLR